MGLFSTITVKKDFSLPLPADLGELTVDEIYQEPFQTKDLGYGMDYYTIHPDGSITEEIYSFGESGGQVKEIKTVGKPQLINFYNSFDKGNNDYWVEFQYMYGDEPKITLFEFKVTPNAERKARENEFWSEQNKRREFLAKWYMRPYVWYTRVIHFIFRKYRWLGQKLPDSWKVEQFLTPL